VKHNIRSVPTLVYISGGEQKSMTTGVLPAVRIKGEIEKL
jgi:hypothetical protein